MRAVFRLLVGAALFGALAVGAASAASTTPTFTPTFTVGVSLTPDTIVRGQTAVATITIANLTESAATANVTFTLVPPRVTPFTPLAGKFAVKLAALETKSKDVTFTVPLKAPVGSYVLTVTVAGAAAPAMVTLHVT